MDTLTPRELLHNSFYNHHMDTPPSIIDTRTILMQGSICKQVLVQWLGSPPDGVSWEGLTVFQECYHEFHLEDKMTFDGGNNDKTPKAPGPILETSVQTGTPMPVCQLFILR